MLSGRHSKTPAPSVSQTRKTGGALEEVSSAVSSSSGSCQGALHVLCDTEAGGQCPNRPISDSPSYTDHLEICPNPSRSKG